MNQKEKAKLEDLLEYPASFTFRVVANHAPSLEQNCQALVEEILGRPVIQVQTQPSKTGSFASVRLTTMVLNADEIRGVYGALKGIEGLRLLL